MMLWRVVYYQPALRRFKNSRVSTPRHDGLSYALKRSQIKANLILGGTFVSSWLEPIYAEAEEGNEG